jgi:hypothetical protein
MHLSICNQYTSLALGVAVCAPAAVVKACMQYVDPAPTNVFYSDPLTLSVFGGAIGLFNAIVVEEIASQIVKSTRIGARRSTRIIQGVQLAGYAAGLACVFGIVMNTNTPESAPKKSPFVPPLIEATLRP